MFDSKTTFAARLSSAVDLMIDFATLGEYGLEPVGSASPDCQARRRPQTSRPRALPGTADRGRGVAVRT